MLACLYPLLSLALQRAPPAAGLFRASSLTRAAPPPTPAPERREFELSSSTLHPAGLHPKGEGASLSAFMAALPTGALMSALQRHLPPNALSCERVGEDGSVWQLTLRCMHIGPRVWGLWLQPRIVLWLRKKARKIEAEAHLCGLDCGAFVWSGGENARICVRDLDVRSSLTWVEESINHLSGDYCPVLLLTSKLRAGLEFRARGGWARLLPSSLLSSLGRRAAGKALQELQQAAAKALVEEYEAWRTAPPPSQLDEAEDAAGGGEEGRPPTFHERLALGSAS